MRTENEIREQIKYLETPNEIAGLPVDGSIAASWLKWVLNAEQGGNVPAANACPQLYEVAPKTEIRDPDTLHRYYMCPNSKCFGGFKAIKRDFEYCPYCGVKLSWRNFL